MSSVDAASDQNLHNDCVEEVADGIILAFFRTYIDRPMKTSLLGALPKDSYESDAFYTSFEKKQRRAACKDAFGP